MGATAQGPVERVAVGVGKTWQRETVQVLAAIGRIGDIRRDRVDVIADDLDHHAGRGVLTAEPRQLTPERDHDPTRSTNAVIRSTNAAR